ncbi:MAG: hypothetical protein GY714_11425 [Desulfobacterales bacterium]|nr:hypothetical protein [Desulfobacterales bacterium]MCP4158840.1 hypothetical protein [Deltaproteobacteria bacterium]
MHELIPPATPNKNAHIEAFYSILEIEFYNRDILNIWASLSGNSQFYGVL